MKKKQIVVVGIILVLVGAYLGAKAYATKVARAKVDKAIANMAAYADVDYGNVSVNLFGMNVKVSDVVVSPAKSKEKYKIKEIVIHNTGNSDSSGIPSELSLSFKGIEIDLKSLGRDAKLAREMGYKDKLSLDTDIAYTYDSKEKELTVHKLAVSASDAGKIGLSFKLGNINLDSKNVFGLLMGYPQVMLYKAEIYYDDDSLMERVFKLQAKQMGMSLKDYKSMLINEIDNGLKTAKNQLHKKVLTAIKKFINKPDKLVITVSPSKPQPIGRIERTSIEEVVKLLNIQVEA